MLLGYRVRIGHRSEPIEIPRILGALWDDASLEEIERIIKDDPKSVHVVGPELGTAMDNALFHNRGDVVRLLLETGWDPNREVESLRMKPSNPLGFAISSGELEIAQTLLDFGADPQKASWHGLSGRELCLECLKGEKLEQGMRMLDGNALGNADDDAE